jgi:hypothetical protein
MPFVLATYLNHIQNANAHFRKFKSSSLDIFNALLNGLPGGALNPGQRRQLIEALGRIPHAKQMKYAAALNYAQTNLNLNIPGIPYGYPVNLSTQLDFYEVSSAAWGHGPADFRADGWFEHNFRIHWESSNGNLASLAPIWNREEVVFQHNPAGPPFNHMMAATPMNYVYGVTHSSTNDGSDNHYFMHPSLMLTYPPAPGLVRAHQAYQYSPDQGATWFNIQNGEFYFDKGVRAAAGGNVFVFLKRNLAPNTRAFWFEVEYPIGAAPANAPISYNTVRGRGTGAQVAPNTYANVISLG